LPGSLGAVTLRHVCEGWPVPGGFVATLAAGTANAASATITTRMLLIAFPLYLGPQGRNDPDNQGLRAASRFGFLFGEHLTVSTLAAIHST
jgi:hypothetical protein